MAVPQEQHLSIADALLDVDSQPITLPMEASSSSADNHGKKRRSIETLSMMTRAAESGNLTSLADVQQMFSSTLQALEATSKQQANTADSLAAKFLRNQNLPKSIQTRVMGDVKILKDRLQALLLLADKGRLISGDVMLQALKKRLNEISNNLSILTIVCVSLAPCRKLFYLINRLGF